MSDDCLFCKIAAGQIPARKCHEDEHMVAFYDIQPQAPTHVLLIPRKHVRSLAEVDDATLPAVSHIMHQIPRLACELGLSQDGFRVVANSGAAAGQSVFHLHFHLLGGRPMAWPPG